MPRILSTLARRLALVAAMLAPLLGTPARPATAQEWQFALTPYVWFAAIGSKIKTGPADGSKFDVSFGEIFDHLAFPPLMLAGEARNGRFGIATDFLIMSLKTDLDTRNLLFNDGRVNMTSVMASVTGYYRALETPTVALDAGAGVRLWHFSSKLKLNPGLLAGRSDTVEQTFADPILALRAGIRLAQGWSVTLMGDIGGFGVSSDLTWQALGTLNWQAADWIELRLGYRYLAFERKKIDMDVSGPILGATFRF